MKHLFPLSTIIAFSFLVITGCQNDPEDLPAPKTKTQLITTGSWQFDKAFSGTIDITTQVPACYKDNVVTFTNATNGTVANTLPCTPTDNTPATFTWQFLSTETVLSLSAPLFPGGTGDFNIVTLSETALVVSQNVTFPGFPTSNVIFHYRH